MPPPPPAPPRNGQPAHPQHAPQPAWPQQDAGHHPQQGYIPPPLAAPHAPHNHQAQASPAHDPSQQGYYFPPQAAAQHDPYGQQYAGHAPPPGQHGQPPVPSLSSYVPAPQNAPWPAPGDAHYNDPQGYDLGHYAAGQGYPGAAEPPPAEFGQYAAAPHARQGYYPPQPGQQGYPQPQGGYEQPYAADPYGQQGQHQFRAPAGQHAGQHAGYDQPLAVPPGEHGHGEPQDDFDEEFAEEEEPRRGRRSLMVVAALVGAIGIGGGLAYGYKKFAGPTAGKQIAVADSAKKSPAPISVAPAPDRKIAERLPDVVPAAVPQAPAAAPSDPQDMGGPRKVQLIPITPSGVPGTAVAGGAPPAGRPTINVPGVTLENMAPPPPVRMPAAAPPPATAAVPTPVPQPPVRQAAVPLRPAPAAPPPAAAEPPPAKTAKAPVAKTKSNDAYAPVGTATASVATAPAAKAGGNGYVAVLASQKSRMDALKVYADLQQKYGEVLSNKPADVQEANLGDKGVYYRAVVGPPGSREAATTLCTQLKTAGYTGCWVTAY